MVAVEPSGIKVIQRHSRYFKAIQRSLMVIKKKHARPVRCERARETQSVFVSPRTIYPADWLRDAMETRSRAALFSDEPAGFRVALVCYMVGNASAMTEEMDAPNGRDS